MKLKLEDAIIKLQAQPTPDDTFSSPDKILQYYLVEAGLARSIGNLVANPPMVKTNNINYDWNQVTVILGLMPKIMSDGVDFLPLIGFDEAAEFKRLITKFRTLCVNYKPATSRSLTGNLHDQIKQTYF